MSQKLNLKESNKVELDVCAQVKFTGPREVKADYRLQQFLEKKLNWSLCEFGITLSNMSKII